jgi:cytochrome c553
MAPSQNPTEIHASLDLTAWSGPWGVSYGANLTPEPETGLGRRYDEASFIKTLRTGKKPEGEDLLPPMPWAVYKAMNDDDLRALYAYLRTIPAVKNNVRSAVPAKRDATGKTLSAR